MKQQKFIFFSVLALGFMSIGFALNILLHFHFNSGFFPLFIFVGVALLGGCLIFAMVRGGNAYSHRVFSLLPLRIGIIDRQNNLLFFHDGENVIPPGRKKHLADLSGFDHDQINQAFQRTFQSRQQITFNYDYQDTSRVMRIAPLPKSLYGCDALLWFSFDNTLLQNTQREFKKLMIRMQLIMDNMPDYVLFQDIADDMRYLMCNKKCEEVLGIPVARIIGKNNRELFADANVADALWRDDLKAAAMDSPLRTVSDFRLADGTLRIGNMFRKMVVEPSGKKLLFMMVSDITEREEHKKELEYTNKLWNAILNAVPCMIFAKEADNEFRYLVANRSFANFVGDDIGKILGGNDYGLFSQPDAEHFRICDSETIEYGCSVDFVEKVNHGGEELTLRTVKMPFRTGDGKNLLIGASIDISHEDTLIAQQKLISETLRKIAMSSDHLDNVRHIVDILRRQTNFDRVAVMRCPQGAQSYNIVYEWCEPDIMPLTLAPRLHCIELLQTLIAKVKNGAIIYFYQNDSDAIRDLCQYFSARAIIAAPIFINGVLDGIVGGIWHSGDRRFSEQDCDRMKAMTSLIALSSMQHSQRQNIERSNRENQTILNNIDIPIALIDRSGNLIRANSAASQLPGFIPDKNNAAARNMAGDNAAESLPQRVASTGQEAQSVHSWNGRDFIIHAKPVCNRNGLLENIVQYAVDITHINALSRYERLINRCLETLLTEEDTRRAIQKSLRLLVENLHAGRGAIFVCTDECAPMRCLAEYSLQGEFYSSELEQTFTPAPSSAWHRALLAGEILAFPDLHDSPVSDSPRHAVWQDHYQAKSAYVGGIVCSGRLIGHIEFIYEKEKRVFSGMELNFLRSAAHMCEVAWHMQLSKKAVLQALDAAQSADKAKSFFLASMSHEIRTPLNAVIGFAELLKDKSLARNEQEEFFAGISASGQALLELINDVLDLSRLEANQTTIHPELCDMTEICRMVTDIFSGKIMEKKLQFSLSIPDLPLLLIDRQRIRQILFNLVGNAVKFTRQGGVRVKVEFAPADAQCGTLKLRVSDTGPGIAPEDREKIFVPFAQGKRMRGTFAENQGTGLGLAICRRLLEQMDGTIAVDGKPGQGSEFTVCLNNVEYTTRTAPPERPTDNAAEKLSGDNHCLLVVDDVPMNRKVLEAMLKKLGFSTLSAASASEAMQLLAANRVAAVLTDLWMPEQNGTELAAAIVRLYPSLPIWAVTADAEAAEHFDLTPFAGILTKPVNMEKLSVLLKN